MLSRSLLFLVLFCAVGAAAQVPPSEFDASIPDASTGVGGAETSQEMEDGRSNTVCAQSRDCERGFTCTSSRCTYVGYRMAPQPGCLGAGAAILMPLALFWRWRRREEG
jgi:hypothetical protein